MSIRLNELELQPRRLVIKIGTGQITDLHSVKEKNIQKIVDEVALLRKEGMEIVLTVSGAIGMGRLVTLKNGDGVSLSIPEKQALAGVGQVKLMNVFSRAFEKHGLLTGQVLLTHAIFEMRGAYLNARNTLERMLKMDIVPVINENDSVAVDEIKVGDNDRLGAMVATLIDADLYIILSDIDGYYEHFGETDEKLLKTVNLEDKELTLAHAGDAGEHFSTGGMRTKLESARITTLSGIPTVIANGFKESILQKILDNISEGTLFISNRLNLRAKKRWIFGKHLHGKIRVDDGAATALKKHNSLLASGILNASGEFAAGDNVAIVDTGGKEIARGLSNYSSDEILRIAGKHSSEIEAALGYKNKYDSVVHVDNLVLVLP